MSSAQSPQEVLEAVRRLEADLDSIRSRARERERDLSDLRRGIAADAAREREQIAEDMARPVDLAGASSPSTHPPIAALAADAVVLAAFTAAKLKSDPAVVAYAVIGIAAVFVAEWIFLSGQRRETNTDSIENKVESGSGDHDRP